MLCQMEFVTQLVEKYCDKILDKSPERMGNWEAELTQEQLECMFLAIYR